MRRCAIVLALAGCHAGAGPVLAISPHGVRVGADVSGGAGPIVGSAGFTTGAGELTQNYVTFDPAYMQGDEASSMRVWAIAVGGTIGATWGGEQEGARFAYGAFAGPVTTRSDGCEPRFAFSVMLGVRKLGDVVEYFMLPKASYMFAIPCL